MNQLWVGIPELSETLQINERTIQRLINTGIFVAGADYYRAGLKRGKYMLSIERCRQRLLEQTKLNNSTEIEIYNEERLANLSTKNAKA